VCGGATRDGNDSSSPLHPPTRRLGAMPGSDTASKTPLPPAPPLAADRAGSEAFPVIPPRLTPTRKTDHRPARSSPLAANRRSPVNVLEVSDSEEEAGAVPEAARLMRSSAEALDEIAEMERATVQRGTELGALEDKLNDAEAQIKRYITSLREQAETGLEKKLVKLSALGVVVDAEKQLIQDVRKKAALTRDRLVETHVDTATREFEALVVVLQERANAILEAQLASAGQFSHVFSRRRLLLLCALLGLAGLGVWVALDGHWHVVEQVLDGEL
jgi:hypothetical protein